MTSNVKNKQSLCMFCKHLIGTTDDDSIKGVDCEAFPKGIPDCFWLGKADHTVPYDGDGGVTFEPRTS